MAWIGTYILNDDGEPVPCYDMRKWGEWFETAREKRRVAWTDLEEMGVISTVFLGLDHHFGPINDPLTYAPILWETMVFGGPCAHDMQRYSSREAALRGHEEFVAKCRGTQNLAF